LDYGVGIVSHETIDEINIHQASMLAMEKSVTGLKIPPDYLFLDGLHKIKRITVEQKSVVDGDVKILSISAASILAKVTRDKLLANLHEQFPEYGFSQHKGYGTRQHRKALLKYGVSPVHRRSFTFVRLVISRFCSFRLFHKNFAELWS
jgi:ribonuclease HII